jgi:L-rhamnose isomerase
MNNRMGKQNSNSDDVIEKMQQFTVELHEGGYGNSGTRFKDFAWPGAARTPREKLADAAEVNNVIGTCPSVAIHIPWDVENDWQAIKNYARSLGLCIVKNSSRDVPRTRNQVGCSQVQKGCHSRAHMRSKRWMLSVPLQ